MTNNRLLMCMPYRQLVQKAVDAGFRVFSIWDPALETPEYLADVAEHSEELVLCDFRDRAGLQRLVAEMAARHDVAHVLHVGREDTQETVAEQAEALGLAPNPAASLTRINDKAAMRGLLRERGLSPMATVEARSPRAAAAVLVEGFALPAVAKPTQLAGSRGVRLIRRPSDVTGWLDELAALDYDGPVLIEEYLRGPEYSVETLTAHGTHHVIGITAKRLGRPPHFVEMGHLHPAPLASGAAAAIAELVVSFLNAAGYRFGPAHTEVILTAAGPRIVESQARLGGDRIPLLVELASGFDIEAAIFHALAGRPIAPPPALRRAAIAYFDFGVGRVQSIEGARDLCAQTYVHALKVNARPGQALAPVTSSASRHGYVVVAATGERTADECLADARARLRVRTCSPAGAAPARARQHVPAAAA
jgi:biotin carboxylase